MDVFWQVRILRQAQMTPAEEIQMLRLCNETQARTIKRQWNKISRQSRKIDRMEAALERAVNRKPTPEEIAEAIFGGSDG